LSGLLVKKISKTIKNKAIVRGVDLEVGFGKAVGLLGPNGAGKTTCFSVITGILSPDSGQIIFNDYDITNLPIYKRARLGIGYLPQETSVFRGLTVAQNILSAIEIFEKDPDKQQEKLEHLLDEFGLSHIRESNAISLSGGERRRTEIARALAAKPKILLLDEPLAGIDPIAMGEIKDIIKKLKSMNLGILITDHNVYETLNIVDTAYVIANGKILCSGTPKEIVENKDVKRFYLGENFSFKG
jgi:lipopolysaccharide export system ATP-binding protein